MIRALAAGFLVLSGGICGAQERAASGGGAILRGLDKVSGAVVDFEVPSGHIAQVFGLDVLLADCRFPAGNPAGDAFAFLQIRQGEQEMPVFSGWMVASSPALNPLDHARYDIWVLRCMTA